MVRIAFRQTGKTALLAGLNTPKASVAVLPRWLKAIPRVVADEPHVFPVGTARACMPFFDAMTAGYMLLLPEALHVHYPEGADTVQFTWRRIEMGLRIDSHSNDQLPVALQQSNGVYKFVQPWGIDLPDTHSALYTHPLNRHDLPFRSFSGVVDGTYSSPVNIPFVWLGEPGNPVTLDAGTPIAQVIPFLREQWQHETLTVGDDEIDADGFAATTHIEGYRRLFRKVKVWR